MQSCPLVSVIILNYNGRRFLGQGLNDCLNSVLNSDYPNFEVIFVDNGSTDDSVAFVQKTYNNSKLRIVKNEENLGFSAGFNAGIRKAKGKYIIPFSNDMKAQKNWIKSTVSFMEKDPKIGLVGFKRLSWNNSGAIDGIGGNLYICGRVKLVGNNETDKGQYENNIQNLDYIGGAMALRRKALQEVGLFNSDFKVFSEDIDLCFRIRKGGYRTVYLHDAVIWHRAHSTLVGIDAKGHLLEYKSNKNRIQCNIIHFKFRRLLAGLLVDAIWFLMTDSISKLLLLKAYHWNLCHLPFTLKKRLLIGPSPPYGCKYPVLPFSFQDLKRRLKKRV